MKLNISISSLQRGQHVECKSLDELLGAEEAIMAACENLRGYLDTAATFDGREVLFDFDTSGPKVIAQSVAPAPALVAPAAAPAPPPALDTAAPPALSAPADAEEAPTYEPEYAQFYASEGFSPANFWSGLTDQQRHIVIGVAIVLVLLLLAGCGGR